MAVATKTRIVIAELPAAQQKLMLAAATVYKAGQPVTINALCTEIEGKATPEVKNRINGVVGALKKKFGGWPWDNFGHVIPEAKQPFTLVWPAGTGIGTVPAATSRTGSAAAVNQQTAIDFIHAIDGAYRELPLEMREQVKGPYARWRTRS